MRLAGLDLDPSERLRYDPRLGWVRDPAASTRIEKRGFRTPPIDREKAPGTRRLLLLGDSFTEGRGVPWESTFAAQLGRQLNGAVDSAADPVEWEVINLGMSGWGTAQELLALRHHGLELQPDGVVLQVLPYNDLCNNNLGQARTCSVQDVHRPYFVLEGEDLKPTALFPWRDRARRTSRLFGLVENRFTWEYRHVVGSNSRQLRDVVRDRRQRALAEAAARGLEHRGTVYSMVPLRAQPPAVVEGWRVTERLLDEIVSELEAAGIPMIGLVVPFPREFDEEWLGRLRELEPALQPEYGTRRVEEAFRRRGIPVISVRELLSSHGLQARDHYYPVGVPYDSHWNTLGHHRVANWIADELARLGMARSTGESSQLPRTADLLAEVLPPVALSGLGPIDEGERAGWGERSTIVFLSDDAGSGTLYATLDARVEARSLVVRINQELAGRWRVEQEEPVELEIPLLIRPGRNEIELRYSGNPPPGPEEPVVRYRRLRLEANR